MIKYLMAFAALALSVPSAAQQQVDPELAQWVERIEVQLNENLDRAARPVRDASGVVTLKFNCSENGKAANVAIAKSSGNRHNRPGSHPGCKHGGELPSPSTRPWTRPAYYGRSEL